MTRRCSRPSTNRRYLGQYDSMRLLNKIAAGITKRYHDDGYVLAIAYLPPQDVTDGTVTIKVAEGAIDAVTTQGAYRDSSVTPRPSLRASRPRSHSTSMRWNVTCFCSVTWPV